MSDDKKPEEGPVNAYPADTDDADARRKTVKKVLLGAGAVGVVQYWTKPFIESTVLPTHGQVTTSSPPPPPSGAAPPPSPPPPSPPPPSPPPPQDGN